MTLCKALKKHKHIRPCINALKHAVHDFQRRRCAVHLPLPGSGGSRLVDFAFSPDGRYLVAAFGEHRPHALQVWQLAAGGLQPTPVRMFAVSRRELRASSPFLFVFVFFPRE